MHAYYFLSTQHKIITVNNETNMEKIFKVSEWSPSIRTVHESKRYFRGQGLQAAIEETPALFVPPSYKHFTLSCVSQLCISSHQRRRTNGPFSHVYFCLSQKTCRIYSLSCLSIHVYSLKSRDKSGRNNQIRITHDNATLKKNRGAQG